MTTIRTVVGAIAALAFLSVFVFAAMNFHSGDEFARSVLGHDVTEQQVHAYAVAHHLDDPLPQRYVQWLSGFVHGDWGTSPISGQVVGPDILQRLPRTAVLAVLALSLGTLMGVTLGAFAAVRMGSRIDISITLLTTGFAGVPTFVLGIGLILVFAVVLHLVPVASFGLLYGTPTEVAQAFILPTVTLALTMVPHIARITRAATRDALSAPYVQSATLRGLPFKRILWNHVMRNAVGPLANVIGLEAIELVSGVIVVENVFGFPGIGQALLSAVSEGDAITVETIVLILGVIFIVTNLITDLVVLYFNPRLRTAAR
jgi:peptide/nickel transport system permease protein